MQALKDNCALKFAVVTGCLKIAKESIFTGTNNFVSDSVADSRLTEYFGFVQSEVDEILKDVMNRSEEDLCLSAPGFDIRGIQHEKLYSRLYMS